MWRSSGTTSPPTPTTASLRQTLLPLTSFHPLTWSGGLGASGQWRRLAPTEWGLGRRLTGTATGATALLPGSASGSWRHAPPVAGDHLPARAAWELPAAPAAGQELGHGGEEPQQEDPYPFTCTIDDPTKQTKFKDMKSYMSYGLTARTQMYKSTAVPLLVTSFPNPRFKRPTTGCRSPGSGRFPSLGAPPAGEAGHGRFGEGFISRRKGLIGG
ncbi:sorting nexin-18-like protein [Lates japonicus]|uniref:Sorting nexin-18-like protein n=1 Tax=Lates japonicus TaxID=270547 RepID=A0AAD3MKK3_LATJO|nr:sorting nexin-18-like protein [Lates japonicus]